VEPIYFRLFGAELPWAGLGIARFKALCFKAFVFGFQKMAFLIRPSGVVDSLRRQ